MIYRLRVILDNDTDDDIFRDIEIRKTDTLEDLHNSITQSFGFDGSEMAVITQALLEANLSEQQIRKVMGENMLTYLQTYLP